ncbi:MAG: hypothetical protein KKA16_01815 [Alphaproteobacteria bacterium]|nr:hypothetical protein [Alphaproteobacteria bacterium]MBU2377967.1 hypothetical protein [Alphaproteobacteria bacterium]
MISMTTASPQPLPFWRTPLPGQAKAVEGQSPGFGLPSLAEMRDSQRAMKKEMAARKVQAVRERRDALMLMVRIDPKAALKMTVEMAKALKEAVEDFVDAGGKNPTDGELAMMHRDSKDAREAANGALEAAPADPMEAGLDGAGVEAPTAEAAKVDAEVKRAQIAYAAAFAVADIRDAKADRAEAVENAANADRGFFMQVKLALGELKEAREKIKADWANLKSPHEDDWKVADKAMAELEKAIDIAPTGAPELSDAPRAVSA